MMQTGSSSALAFSENLDRLMYHSRTSNNDLAELLGVSPVYISRWRHRPSTLIRFQHLDRLMGFFHVDPNTLLLP